MKTENITTSISVPMMWTVIDKKDYQKYHILSTSDVSAVCSWFASDGKDSQAIVTLYDYGSNKNLVAEIDEGFKQIKQNPDLQSQYNIIPVLCKKAKIGNKQTYFSAVKTAEFSSVAIDVYFAYEDKNYALHTVVDSIEEGEELNKIIASNSRLIKICEIVKSL